TLLICLWEIPDSSSNAHFMQRLTSASVGERARKSGDQYHRRGAAGIACAGAGLRQVGQYRRVGLTCSDHGSRIMRQFGQFILNVFVVSSCGRVRNLDECRGSENDSRGEDKFAEHRNSPGSVERILTKGSCVGGLDLSRPDQGSIAVPSPGSAVSRSSRS